MSQNPQKLKRTEQLYSTFRSYVSHFSVENEHIYRMLFHVALGKIIKAKMLWGGREVSLREHLFIIQQSGTGKSEAVKSLRLLLKNQFNLRTLMLTTATDASFMGQFVEVKDLKNKTTRDEPRYGALHNYDFIDWDEGSVVIKGGRFADNMSDILQMAMDEPGYVCRGLGRGTLEFYTDTSIVAGSYEFEQFSSTMLEKGMLQRMLHAVKYFSKDEKMKMEAAKIRMARCHDLKSIMQLQTKFKDEFYAQKYAQKVDFDDEGNDKYEQDMLKYYELAIYGQYADRKQQALEGFYNRMDIHIRKISAQVALIEGSETVKYEHLRYAMDIVESSLESVKSLLDRVSRRTAHKAVMYRRKVITTILRKQPMSQNDLMKQLHVKKNDGEWDLGFNKTLDFIAVLVKEGFVIAKPGSKNAKVLSVLDGI